MLDVSKFKGRVPDGRSLLEVAGFRGRTLDVFVPSVKSEEHPENQFRVCGIIEADYYEWLLGDSAVYPKDLDAFLKGRTGDIEIVINSPGGDYFAGVEMMNAIQGYSGGDVNVRIVGLAASAASLVAMGGDRVDMTPGSMIMIHRAWTLAAGNALELMAVAERLDKIDNMAAGVYAKRSGKDDADVLEMLDAETWFTADEAVENGFANSVLEKEPEMGEDEGDQEDVQNLADAALRRGAEMTMLRYALGGGS